MLENSGRPGPPGRMEHEATPEGIVAALDHSKVRLEKLSAALSELGGHLSPVLSPDLPSTGTSATGPRNAAASPLLDEIWSQGNTLSSLIYRTEDLIARLTI